MLCVDMDNCAAPAELQAKLATDKHVLSAFLSPTGSGVKVGVRVKADASLHGASFAAARKHFGEAYGVTIDEPCKNVSRLCFASYAPVYSSGKRTLKSSNRYRSKSSRRNQSPSRKPKPTNRCRGHATGSTTTVAQRR